MGDAKRRRKKPQRDTVGHALGPMPSRGQIDTWTHKYFSEISSLMETITDDTERAALCSNALEEARGKELPLACHPSCGRALEKLLQSADSARCLSFLDQCTSSFASMAMDPSGSHVAEAMLTSVADSLQQSNSSTFASVENALARVSEVLQGSALDIMESKYGSHVLRKFTLLVAGLAEKNEKDGLSRKLGGTSAREKPLECVHQDFPAILKPLVNSVLVASRNSLFEHPFASLVSQTFLKALHGAGHDTSEAISTILDLGDMKETIASNKVENVLEMMENQNGSHLMEIVLEVASDELYNKLLQEVCKDNLKRLAGHQFSNFVVQTLIACARQQDQVTLFLDELGKDFADLLKNKRTGVIVSLLGASSRLKTGQQEICRMLAAALCPQSRDSLVPRLLHLEGQEAENKGAKAGCKMSTLGCAILQTTFTFSQECSQQFYKSFSSLEPTLLLDAAKDKAGCHVLEAFIKSSASSKQKHSIIGRLKGHFAELATDTKAHYVVTKCFDAADVKLKEAIVVELLHVEQELSKLKHGPYILSKLNVSKYARAPDKWRHHEKSSQASKDDYATLFASGSKDDHLPKRKKHKLQ